MRVYGSRRRLANRLRDRLKKDIAVDPAAVDVVRSKIAGGLFCSSIVPITPFVPFALVP
jgi:hypothetical protein